MPNEITSANLAQAIAKLVAAEALPALAAQFSMALLVNRDFEPTLAKAGDVVNVPISPVLTANNIAEAGTVVNQNPNLGNAQIVLNKHLESTFVVNDVVNAVANISLLRTYMQPAMIAIAEGVESDLLNLYPLFTSNAAVGGTTAIDEARVDAAETALFDARVPASEPRYLMLASAAYGKLRQIGRFSENLTYGNGLPIQTGQVLQVKGFNVFRSQLVPKVTDNYNLAFTRNAIGLATRRLPMPLPGTGAIAEYAELPGSGIGCRVVMSYQPSTLSQQFTVDILYGVGVLRNNHAVQVRSND
jgi:hypothetical protein